MPEWLLALIRIAGMFLVMLVGRLATGRGYLGRDATVALARFTADVALPALILGQMLQTVDAHTLAADWYVPLLAVGVVGTALLAGLVVAPLFVRGPQRRTWLFVVAISNWVYLPLPIAETLYGEPGRLAVLLYNVGGLVMLWTVGIWTLRGGAPSLATLRELVTNPGLIATAGGVALALALPSLKGGAEAFGISRAAGASAEALVQAVNMLGSLTIPLSLLITGAQLGGLELRGGGARPLLGVLAVRLLVAPAIAVAALALAIGAGILPPSPLAKTTALIAGMPVALNCGVLAERYGGDASLASRAVFVTTLASVVSVPLLLLAANAAGL